MEKIDIIELVKTLIKLRINKSSHRVLFGFILIAFIWWAIGTYNIGECNEILLLIPLIIGIFLILSVILNSDKTKMTWRTRLIDGIFALSYIFIISLFLFKYYNCSGLNKIIIFPNNGEKEPKVVIVKEKCTPIVKEKIIKEFIIKEVEKSPHNIYNINLNYSIKIYEATTIVINNFTQKNYYIEYNHFFTPSSSTFYSSFLWGIKKSYFTFFGYPEFTSKNEISNHIISLVNGMSIQKDNFTSLSAHKDLNQIIVKLDTVNLYLDSWQDNLIKVDSLIDNYFISDSLKIIELKAQILALQEENSKINIKRRSPPVKDCRQEFISYMKNSGDYCNSCLEAFLKKFD